MAPQTMKDLLAQYRKDISFIPNTWPSRASVNPTFSPEKSEIVDIDEVVKLDRSALDVCPPGHPGRALSLRSLASTLWDRYKRQYTMSDLEEAIMLCRAALEIYPLGYSGRVTTFSQLALCLEERSIELDINSDLDEAIAIQRLTLDLYSTPLDRSASLHQLARCLYHRSVKQNNIPDVDEAIALSRSALDICPLGPYNLTQVITLGNLAGYLEQRFLILGTLTDIDEAIAHRRSELDFLPTDHILRFQSLYSLASGLYCRYREKNTTSDLHEAVVLYRCALELPSIPHYFFGPTLESLDKCLNEIFKDHRPTHHSDLSKNPFGHCQLAKGRGVISGSWFKHINNNNNNNNNNTKHIREWLVIFARKMFQ